MDKMDLLKQAILSRKPIQFEYNAPDEVIGFRIGNPHVLFIHPTTKNRAVHVFQTGGVSRSGLTNGLPWRLFIIDFIENIQVLTNEPSFNVAEGYNPDSPLYIDAIVKV
ncbi:MAG: hypothetical protein PHO28_02160 [Candidatus Pacebacteria bacterium]|nr:hypothetical protein [Candidatus Paceibacterota bacterium]